MFRYINFSKKFFSSNIKKNIITIKDNAWNKMNNIIGDGNKDDKIFLFSASSGGCNGFNYNLELIKKDMIQTLSSNKTPINFLEKNDISVYIEPKSEFLLLGTTIDYEQENYDLGIFESKFIFIPNRKIASSCGCGISFSLK